MVCSQPTLLTWCGGCKSYATDPLTHRCSETHERRAAMAQLASRTDQRERRRQYQRAYDAHRLEQARLRREGRAA